jgi:nitrite reductase/ring-hydroxylating ferredoxin subunit
MNRIRKSFFIDKLFIFRYYNKYLIIPIILGSNINFAVLKFYPVTFISKIKLFLIVLTFAITLGSCNKKNDVIPDVYVDFTLDLYDPQFVDLNAIGGSDTIDARTNNWGSGAAGYNGNGIIVSRGVDEFFAYDRTCPHDYEVNTLSIKVSIDPKNFAKAVCPKCHTTYELLSFGTPASGPGRYPLKNYRTNFDGRFVRVWNNY